MVREALPSKAEMKEMIKENIEMYGVPSPYVDPDNMDYGEQYYNRVELSLTGQFLLGATIITVFGSLMYICAGQKPSRARQEEGDLDVRGWLFVRQEGEGEGGSGVRCRLVTLWRARYRLYRRLR